MKKGTLSIILVTILLGSFLVRAEESLWPTVTVSSLVSSKYLGFGTGNLLSEDPAVQSDICFLFKNGLYIDLWSSRSLQGGWNNGSLGNEIDYQIGWRGTLATNLSLNVGMTYFDEPKAFKFGAGDVLYPHAFLTKNFKHLSATVGFENFTTMPDSGFQGGNLLSLGISKTRQFHGDKLILQASATLVYDTGTLGSGEGFILRGTTSVNWKISKLVTLNIVGMNWYAPITPHDKREVDAVFYSGLSVRLN